MSRFIKYINLENEAFAAALSRIRDDGIRRNDTDIRTTARQYLRMFGNGLATPALRPNEALESAQQESYLKDFKFHINSLNLKTNTIKEKIGSCAKDAFANLKEIQRELIGLISETAEEEIKLLGNFSKCHFNAFTRGIDSQLLWDDKRALKDFKTGYVFREKNLMHIMPDAGLTLPIKQFVEIPILDVYIIDEKTDVGDTVYPLQVSPPKNLIRKNKVFNHVILRKEFDHTSRKFKSKTSFDTYPYNCVSTLTIELEMPNMVQLNYITFVPIGDSSITIPPDGLSYKSEDGSEISLLSTSIPGETSTTLFFQPIKTKYLRVSFEQHGVVGRREMVVGDKRIRAFNNILDNTEMHARYPDTSDQVAGKVYDFSLSDISVGLLAFERRGIFRSANSIKVDSPLGFDLKWEVEQIVPVDTFDTYIKSLTLPEGKTLLESYLYAKLYGGSTLNEKVSPISSGGKKLKATDILKDTLLFDGLIPLPDTYPIQIEYLDPVVDIAKVKLFPDTRWNTTQHVVKNISIGQDIIGIDGEYGLDSLVCDLPPSEVTEIYEALDINKELLIPSYTLANYPAVDVFSAQNWKHAFAREKIESLISSALVTLRGGPSKPYNIIYIPPSVSDLEYLLGLKWFVSDQQLRNAIVAKPEDYLLLSSSVLSGHSKALTKDTFEDRKAEKQARENKDLEDKIDSLEKEITTYIIEWEEDGGTEEEAEEQQFIIDLRSIIQEYHRRLAEGRKHQADLDKYRSKKITMYARTNLIPLAGVATDPLGNSILNSKLLELTLETVTQNSEIDTITVSMKAVRQPIVNTDTQIAHLNIKDRYLVERLTTINSTAKALQNFYIELIKQYNILKDYEHVEDYRFSENVITQFIIEEAAIKIRELSDSGDALFYKWCLAMHLGRPSYYKTQATTAIEDFNESIGYNTYHWKEAQGFTGTSNFFAAKFMSDKTGEDTVVSDPIRHYKSLNIHSIWLYFADVPLRKRHYNSCKHKPMSTLSVDIDLSLEGGNRSRPNHQQSWATAESITGNIVSTVNPTYRHYKELPLGEGVYNLWAPWRRPPTDTWLEDSLEWQLYNNSEKPLDENGDPNPNVGHWRSTDELIRFSISFFFFALGKTKRLMTWRFTTEENHGLNIGDIVAFNGNPSSVLDGKYNVVGVPSAKTFNISIMDSSNFPMIRSLDPRCSKFKDITDPEVSAHWADPNAFYGFHDWPEIWSYYLQNTRISRRGGWLPFVLRVNNPGALHYMFDSFLDSGVSVMNWDGDDQALGGTISEYNIDNCEEDQSCFSDEPKLNENTIKCFDSGFQSGPIEVYKNDTLLSIGIDYDISVNSGSDWLAFWPVDSSTNLFWRNALAGNFLIRFRNSSPTAIYWVKYRVNKDQDLSGDKKILLKNGRVTCSESVKNASGMINTIFIARTRTANPYITPLLRNYSLRIQEKPSVKRDSGKLEDEKLFEAKRRSTTHVS